MNEYMKTVNPIKRFGLPLAALVLIGCAFAQQKGWFDFHTFTSQGPVAAERELGVNFDPNATHEDLYVTAWSRYAKGDYQGAIAIVNHILKQGPSTEIDAKCDYLLGHANEKMGEENNAKGFLLSALDKFESQQDFSNAYKTYLGLAKLAVKQGQFDIAEGYFSQAEPLKSFARSGDSGFHYAVRARAAHEMKKYDLALRYSKDAVIAYENEGDKNGLASAMSSAAFYHIITGDLKEGRALSDKAEMLIMDLGDTNLLFGNKINELVVRRCLKQPFDFMTESIRGYAMRNQDKALLADLELALTVKCPEVNRIGDPDAPPPDNSLD